MSALQTQTSGGINPFTCVTLIKLVVLKNDVE